MVQMNRSLVQVKRHEQVLCKILLIGLSFNPLIVNLANKIWKDIEKVHIREWMKWIMQASHCEKLPWFYQI